MFVGRKHELSMLNESWDKPHAAFVVCKGRRRIGKSRLIQQFGQTVEIFMEFQGAAPDRNIRDQEQMNIFVDQLCAQTNIPRFQPDSWQQIFSFLAMAVKPDQKTIILLDEISWMASKSRSFSAQLKIVWDTKFKDVLSVRPVLIYEGMLSKELQREDFFDRIIRFSDLLVE